MTAHESPTPLCCLVEGDARSGGETFVLVHGFPDDPAVFQESAARLLARGHRVLRVTLPGFEEGAQGEVPLPFDLVVERLYRTLAHERALGATLVGHDWGAIFLYRLVERHPDAAGRLVTLEVGAGPRSLLLTLFVLTYHALIILAFALGEGLGDRVMRGLCHLMPRPSYPGALRPCARHGWLYRQAWREGSSHGPWPLYYRNAIAAWAPPKGLPFLFLYGEESPRLLRFHSKAWRQSITSESAVSQSVGLPGGHWCFVEHPELFIDALDSFIEASGERRA